MRSIPENRAPRQLPRKSFRLGLTGLALCAALAGSTIAIAAKSDVHQFEKTVRVLLPVSEDYELGQWAQNFVVLGKRYLSKGLKLFNEPKSKGKDAWKRLQSSGPDGHTTMFGATYIWESGLFDSKLSDIVGGSRVACLVTEMQYVLIAKNSSRFKTFQDVLIQARQEPDSIRVSGNFEGLVAAYNMANQLQIDLTYFQPESGSRKALNTKQADLAVVETFRFLHPKYKNYRGIAVLGDISMPKKAWDKSPDLMTPATLGFKGMTFPRWIAMHPETSEKDIARMSDAFGTMMRNPKYVRMMENFGLPVEFEPHTVARESIEELQENLHWLAAGLAREGIRFNMRTMSAR